MKSSYRERAEYNLEMSKVPRTFIITTSAATPTTSATTSRIGSPSIARSSSANDRSSSVLPPL
jgi:hypothetical protein